MAIIVRRHVKRELREIMRDFMFTQEFPLGCQIKIRTENTQTGKLRVIRSNRICAHIELKKRIADDVTLGQALLKLLGSIKFNENVSALAFGPDGSNIKPQTHLRTIRAMTPQKTDDEIEIEQIAIDALDGLSCLDDDSEHPPLDAIVAELVDRYGPTTAQAALTKVLQREYPSRF